MIDILFYGSGEDSQQVIDALDNVIDANYGYRFEPASRRDDNRSVWGVLIDDDSVDKEIVTDALKSEFGEIKPADK